MQCKGLQSSTYFKVTHQPPDLRPQFRPLVRTAVPVLLERFEKIFEWICMNMKPFWLNIWVPPGSTSVARGVSTDCVSDAAVWWWAARVSCWSARLCYLFDWSRLGCSAKVCFGLPYKNLISFEVVWNHTFLFLAQGTCGYACGEAKWDYVLKLWRSRCLRMTLHPIRMTERKSQHECVSCLGPLWGHGLWRNEPIFSTFQSLKKTVRVPPSAEGRSSTGVDICVSDSQCCCNLACRWFKSYFFDIFFAI